MKVTITFNDDLKDRYAPGTDGVIQLILQDGATVKDVFDTLRIDDGDVGFVLLNERKVQKEEIISDSDVIRIFSLVAGG